MRLPLDKASFFVYICKVFGGCGACVVPEIQLVAADPKKLESVFVRVSDVL